MARGTGYSTSNTIDCPPYIIESIIRDEMLTEHDLVISAKDYGNNTMDFDGSTGFLERATDDYYNDAYLHNVTKNWVKAVTDYAGASKRITVASISAGGIEEADVGDFCFLTNIQANLNTTTIDNIGNTSTGTRKDWVFAGSIDSKRSSTEIIQELCFESFCIIFKSYQDYKLVDMDVSGSPLATWTTPAKRFGAPVVSASLSPAANVFADFVLNYSYDPGRGDYLKTITCNKNGGDLASGYITKCADAESNYRKKQKYEYSSKWIYDDDTAIYFLQKLVDWFSMQRLIVSWEGWVKDYIIYEIGDKVLLNYSKMIPTGINNVSEFMITGKTINMLDGDPTINFQLIQLGT